ncbi:hypothetical protein MEO94_26040 [Dolichospermum sp. ST_sed9]|jgi:predicted component of viral defense system (DUF524 family)|nr:hypothetical protein [Dolichospermum sp. ST_sed9]
MSSKTFRLELKEGLLIIPSEVREYLSQCSENSQIALMIQSSVSKTFETSDISEINQGDLQMKWNNWFEEVDNLEILPSSSQLDDYRSALLKKYRSQGLDI